MATTVVGLSALLLEAKVGAGDEPRTAELTSGLAAEVVRGEDTPIVKLRSYGISDVRGRAIVSKDDLAAPGLAIILAYDEPYSVGRLTPPE